VRDERKFHDMPYSVDEKKCSRKSKTQREGMGLQEYHAMPSLRDVAHDGWLLTFIIYTVQKILSINLCSWSLCGIECKLGHYWTQKFLTSCPGIFCAVSELEHFTPNSMKKYVLFESPFTSSVLAPCSYHRIKLKLVSALFRSSFTSSLL
jgi:hypothetical protein